MNTKNSNSNKKPNLFISYGRQPRQYVDLVLKITNDLEKSGYKIWIDSDELKSKQDWELVLEKAIQENDEIIFMMTEHSTRRPDGYCLNELSYGLINKKNILPVMIEMVTPPLSICRLQWIDMLNIFESNGKIDSEKYKIAFDKLLISIDKADINTYSDSNTMTLVDKLVPQNFDYDIGYHTKNFVGREWVFKIIKDHIQSKDTSSILWFIAEPGFGKTAISANATYKIQNVAGIFFCQYDSYMRTDIIEFIKTFAYHLSSQILEYKLLIEKFENAELKRWEHNSSRDLFQRLIIEPLNKISTPKDNYLYIIDALDEAIKDNYDILNLVAKEFPKLPSWIKIFITSRYNTDIEIQLSHLNPIYLDTNSIENLDDITFFINKFIPNLNQQQLNLLVEKSEANILYIKNIYESLVLNKISLDHLETFPVGLNSQYYSYFQREYEDIEYYKNKIRPLFELMIIFKEPISQILISNMLDWDEYIYNEVIDITRSMIKINEYGIEFYHKSLIDWLIDVKKCSKNYYISESIGLEKCISNESWLYTASYQAIASLLPKIGNKMTCDFNQLFIEYYNNFDFTNKFDYWNKDIPVLEEIYKLTDKTYINNLVFEYVNESIQKGLEVFSQDKLNTQNRMSAFTLIFGSLSSVIKLHNEEFLIFLADNLSFDIDIFLEYFNYNEILNYYPGIYYDLGFMYYEYKKYLSAIELFKLSLLYERNDDEYFSHNMLGICYMFLAEMVDGDDISNEEKAIFHYNIALELNPERTDDKMLFDLGLAYIYTKDYVKAIEVLEKALNYNPNRGDVLSRLGSLYNVLEDFSKALSYILKAIELDKNDSTKYYTLGQIYNNMNQIHNAIDAYRESMALDNSNFMALCNLSDAYIKLSEFETAKKYAKLALDIEPEDDISMSNLAQSYEGLGEIKKAVELYENILLLNLNSQDAKDGLNRLLKFSS